MEILAFTYAAAAHEDPSPQPELAIAPLSRLHEWMPARSGSLLLSTLISSAAIATALLVSPDAALALRAGDAGLDVERLQLALQTRGYYSGPINGFYGSRLEDSVSAFQFDSGLPDTGIADLETLALLGTGAGSGGGVSTLPPVRPTPPIAVQPPVSPTRPGVSSGYRTGVVRTNFGVGINVRTAPAGPIIDGRPDGALVYYDPNSGTYTSGYTWVRTAEGMWVAENYLRGGAQAVPYY